MVHFLQPLYEGLRLREVNDWVGLPKRPRNLMKLGQLNCAAIKYKGLPGSGHILLNLATLHFFFDNEYKYEEFWSELYANYICYVKGDLTCIFLSWLLTMEILALKTRSLKLKDAVVQEGCLTLPCDVYMGHSFFVPVALCCRVFNMVHSLGYLLVGKFSLVAQGYLVG